MRVGMKTAKSTTSNSIKSEFFARHFGDAYTLGMRNICSILLLVPLCLPAFACKMTPLDADVGKYSAVLDHLSDLKEYSSYNIQKFGDGLLVLSNEKSCARIIWGVNIEASCAIGVSKFEKVKCQPEDLL